MSFPNKLRARTCLFFIPPPHVYHPFLLCFSQNLEGSKKKCGSVIPHFKSEESQIGRVVSSPFHFMKTEKQRSVRVFSTLLDFMRRVPRESSFHPCLSPFKEAI